MSGGRAFPGWLVGVSLFGATISSITFVAYPADAFKTGYLRYVICITLPFAVLIASRFFVPFFRRGKITSVFEYLESRFGPRVRVYAACVFIISQCFRISLIQFLVALLVHRITGWDVSVCILVGGVVTAYYTVVGGIEAVIWTDFIQSVILTVGGLLILAGDPCTGCRAGWGQMLSVAWADGKFLLNEKVADGTLKPIPWGLSLSHKTVGDAAHRGPVSVAWRIQFQPVRTSRSIAVPVPPKTQGKPSGCPASSACPPGGTSCSSARGCTCSTRCFPTRPRRTCSRGTRKAEEILPYFVTTQLPPGTGGIVVAAVLAAAMSSMSSAMNSISAVAVTDLYKRPHGHRPRRHTLRARRAGA